MRFLLLVFIGNHKTKKDVLPHSWLIQDEPDTLSNRCIVLQSNGGRSLWNWDICDHPLSFVCEYGKKYLIVYIYAKQ